MIPSFTAFALLLAVFPTLAGAQTCADPHYRWTEKTSLDQLTLTPVATTITRMLNSWGVPEIYAGNASRCLDRAGRELRNYRVYGWIRRVKKGESDGDWHFELTATKTGAVVSYFAG